MNKKESDVPPKLTIDDFRGFFEELYEHPPFHWQQRLAKRACAGDWPDFIKLPTSSGKTACLDIAVFALACQAAEHHDAPERITAPRRIFFVVDRRVIVNEAYQRATAICNALEKAIENRSSPLYPVAHWLRSLTHHEHATPLDCFELRGGIYRDDAWVRSMLQPTILTSTVDQFGSRILFRGYGVTDRNLAIHAALTSNDTLVILDEAHCSQPFSQTMNAVARFRDAGLPHDTRPKWSESAIRTPFAFVQMTATPDANASPESIFELSPTDYRKDPKLLERHACAKPIRLEECKAKGKRQNADLAKSLAQQAEQLANPEGDETPCRRIAVVVNRVACARETYRLLTKKHGERVHLMIGRMRPVDRDKLTDRLQTEFQSDPSRDNDNQPEEPQFVVATQCLEVGADFDFDGMVSQCASLDALRQRYGRLNRLGQASHARGVIAMAAGDVKPKDPDPIYGTALPVTWKWLQSHAGKVNDSNSIDFGIQAMDAVIAEEPDGASLAPQSVDAPVLLPAHLDLLCQTSPLPAVEPEIATFLHGPDRGQPEVRVCWRADLPQLTGKLKPGSGWAATAREAVAVCPPTSAEVLAVPLMQFKQWLRGDDKEDNTGDVLGERTADDSSVETNSSAERFGILWTGQTDRPTLVTTVTARNIRPNDTIVLPVTVGGWQTFGHLPGAPEERTYNEELNAERLQELARVDVASCAFRQARNRTIARIHPALAKNTADTRLISSMKKWIDPDSGGTARDALYGSAEDEDTVSADEESDSVQESQASEIEPVLQRLRQDCEKQRSTKDSIQLVRYPNGLALVGPRDASQHESRRNLPRASFGDDFEEANVDADDRILLSDHLADVAEETSRLLKAIPPEADISAAVVEAARLHDIGKADLRFQAMLLQSTPDFACMQPALIAKSGRGPSAKQASGQEVSHSLPRGFRHEMLSVDLAKTVDSNLNDKQRELMLHAIAAHHGYARPFAPVVVDNAPSAVSLKKLNGNSDISLTEKERRSLTPSHRLDSGIAERFWKLNRHFGWWGLTWLETAVRLSDWTASAHPRHPSASAAVIANTTAPGPAILHKLCCPGIDGSNPLGFLSALGLLRTAVELDPSAKLNWQKSGVWTPVLWLTEDFTTTGFVEALHSRLGGRESDFHFTALGQNTTVPQAVFRAALLDAREHSAITARTTVDFFAALGTDALVSENDGITIQDTALRTMAGAGHQHFLETMRNVIKACSAGHLKKALFDAWQYDDPTQTMSLRFDPLGDNRYALQWRNPSGDPSRKKSGSMLGANRLAIEALPFFPTAPGSRFIQTVGFKGHRSRDTFFRWPLWTTPICAKVVSSLLATNLIQSDNKPDYREYGVSEIFASQRITVGKVRNFTPAQAVGHRAKT